MEEAIKNYLKQSFLSLIPRGHRRRQRAASSGASAPATSITRLRSGMPSAQAPAKHPSTSTRVSAAASPATHTRAPRSNGMRRRGHAGYVRPAYLAPRLQAASISPPMFRIG